jgi:membrane protease YdiL (CAAX protease family)
MCDAIHKTRVRRILLLLVVLQAVILSIMFSGNPSKVPEYLGFAAGKQGTVLAWVLATGVALAYVWSASTLSDVKRYLFRLDRLKLIAVVAVIMAGIIEEVVFRKLLMDALHAPGFGSVCKWRHLPSASASSTLPGVSTVWLQG